MRASASGVSQAVIKTASTIAETAQTGGDGFKRPAAGLPISGDDRCRRQVWEHLIGRRDNDNL